MTMPGTSTSRRFRCGGAALLLLLAVSAEAQIHSWVPGRRRIDHAECCGPRRNAALDAQENPGVVLTVPALPATTSTGDLPKVPAQPAPVKPTAVPVGPTALVPDADGVYRINFDFLASYEFVAPAETAQAPVAENQIPANVKFLHEKKVAVTGFMLPVKMSEGRVTEFLLMRDQSMCCFGTVPRLNEWIIVRMQGAGVEAMMDRPVTFEGRMQVGQIYENGFLAGLYQLAAERLLAAGGE